MDKYEYKVRADEIKTLIADGEYAEAVKIADSIDWRRVKSVMMLCTISDLYKINRRYEESRDILLLAYERHTGGRLIVYSLCELSIKLEEYVQAIEYYKEFVQIAPKDTGRYILQYKLYEAQDVSLEERIAVLEEFKKKEYREKWAYELAYLYHRVGLATKCVEECNEMFLWFGEGRYVLKALELKALHEALTPEQQAKLDELKEGAQEVPFTTGRVEINEVAREATEDEEDGEFARDEEEEDSESVPETTREIPVKDLDIQVKPVDVSQYNTINLQKELAESMRDFLEDGTVEQPVEQEQTQELPQPDYNDIETTLIPTGEVQKALDAQSPLQLQHTDEIKPVNFAQMNQQPVAQEVFFGDTAEVNIEEIAAQTVDQGMARVVYPGQIAAPGQTPKPEQPASQQMEMFAGEQPAQTQQASGNQSAMTHTGIIKTFIKPSGYDDILSQEYDGQISLAISEQKGLEKQITGQLSIEDIMAEWERMKKENERKRMEDVRKRVQSQTDTLLADFDESTKTGVLEQLEKVMVAAVIKEEEQRAEVERPKVVKIADIENQEAAKPQEEETTKPAPDNEEEITSVELLTEEAVPAEQTETKEAATIAEDIAQMSGEIEQTDSQEVEDGNEESIEIPDTVVPVEETEEVTEETAEAESKAQDETAAEAVEEIKEEPSKEETKQAKPAEKEEDKDKVRKMTDSEREQFAPYIHHKKTKKQIIDVLDNISLAAYTGNVIITGEEGAGTVSLAKLLVREVQLSDSNFSGKVAKISGATLNKKNVADMLGKLANGALIIEGAAAMKADTVTKLLGALEQENSGLIVLLEDGKEKMESFLAKNEALLPAFNLRVDVEALDDQTLVKYAKKYAEELEYSIDEFGILALHTRIAEMQTSDHEVTVAEVEEIVEEAIYYADKKTPKHFFDILFGKRYDEEDMIILREKDFMHY